MVTEKRLIDAVNVECALIAICARESGIPIAVAEWLSGVIRNAPTVDAVEVVHGEWATIEDDYTGMVALQCSECNQEWWFEDEPPMKIYHYCPNCGAKMDGDGNG